MTRYSTNPATDNNIIYFYQNTRFNAITALTMCLDTPPMASCPFLASWPPKKQRVQKSNVLQQYKQDGYENDLLPHPLTDGSWRNQGALLGRTPKEDD